MSDQEIVNVIVPSSGQVASRFVSSSDLEIARQKREEEWKETYKKLGQEVPPMPKEEYDGRSLYEKLKETKDKKQEAFEEQLKFKNQFRALDDEEVAFLDDTVQEQRLAEIEKEKSIKEEMDRFKKAIAIRTIEPIKGSSNLNSPNNLTSMISSNSITKPLTKKSKKSKDFQSNFLANAIRPVNGRSKKRKSLNTTTTTNNHETDLPKVENHQIESSNSNSNKKQKLP